MKSILAALLQLMIGPALADDPRATQLEYTWSKTCVGTTGNDSHCPVSADASAACYPAGGRIVIGDNLTAIISTRHPLKTGGMDIQIDDATPLYVSASCAAFECKGELAIDGEFIKRLKRARMLIVQAVNSESRTIRLSIPLSDFEKTYEGPSRRLSALYLSGRVDMSLATQAAIRNLPICDD